MKSLRAPPTVYVPVISLLWRQRQPVLPVKSDLHSVDGPGDQKGPRIKATAQSGLMWASRQPLALRGRRGHGQGGADRDIQERDERVRGSFCC